MRERTKKMKIVFQVSEKKAESWDQLKLKLLDHKLEVEEDSLIDVLIQKLEKEIESEKKKKETR